MFSTWGMSGRKAKFSYLAFFPVNLRALWTVARGEKISFTVTPKARQEGNFLYLVYPQLAVMVLTAAGICFGWTGFVTGIGSHTIEALVINTFWGMNNMFAMTGMVKAAFWQPPKETSDAKSQDPGPNANGDSDNNNGSSLPLAA